jgi:hypothetical protein
VSKLNGPETNIQRNPKMELKFCFKGFESRDFSEIWDVWPIGDWFGQILLPNNHPKSLTYAVDFEVLVDSRVVTMLGEKITGHNSLDLGFKISRYQGGQTDVDSKRPLFFLNVLKKNNARMYLWSENCYPYTILQVMLEQHNMSCSCGSTATKWTIYSWFCNVGI